MGNRRSVRKGHRANDPEADGGSGPSGGSERVGADDAGDEAPSGACLVDGMWSAPGRDEEKAGVEDGDDCE